MINRYFIIVLFLFPIALLAQTVPALQFLKESDYLRLNRSKDSIQTPPVSPTASADPDGNYILVVDTKGLDASRIDIQIGSSSGTKNYFAGSFILGSSISFPPKCYYSTDGNKHFLKVYLSSLPAGSAKTSKYCQVTVSDLAGKKLPILSVVVND
jgi:hypothetical protein